MSKEAILNELSKNKKLRTIAMKIGGYGANGLGEDLYQQLFITLCTMDSAKVVKANDGKYLEFMCIKIMSNAFHNNYGEFAKLYRKPLNVELIEIKDYMVGVEQDEIKMGKDSEVEDMETILDFLNQEITQENFYKVTLVKRWVNGESCRKISTMTQIPYRTVAKEIQNTLAELKEQCL